MSNIDVIKGGICAVEGVRAAGTREGKYGLTVIESKGSNASAVFTSNNVVAAPVIHTKEMIKGGKVSLVVANSGNANCFTGEDGIADCDKTIEFASGLTDIPSNEIATASTGVIGRKMPMDIILPLVEESISKLDNSIESSTDAAKSLMTTDTYHKEFAVETTVNGEKVRIGGITKGVGMIAPNMGTMLCFLATDAVISSEMINKALKSAVNKSFNMIVVEPFAMVARNPVAKDFGIALNHAGGAGMNLDVYVMPETVCFSGIAMEEVPSTTGIHQGYFANVYFTNVWYHTIAMRAGRWKNISPGNWWDTDRAWMGEDLPRELPNGEMTFDLSVGVWSSGMLVWDITWGWSEKDRAPGDLPVGQVAVPYNQTFTFYPDGTLEVLKFQQVVSRGTNNVIRLNGEVVQGVPLTLEETNEINGND